MRGDEPDAAVERGKVAEQVAARLGGRWLACAESCTAGRIASTFAGVTGAAEWFRGGLVAYDTSVKRSLLDVGAGSVFSTRAAEEMVEGISRLLDAPVALATTGVAGDDPEDGVEPGTVFVATRSDGRTRVHVHRFDGSPEDVVDQATSQAIADLLDHLCDR